MSSPPPAALDAAKPTSVRLTLPARAEHVALARQVLAGLAEALDVEEELVADMKIAVTEAVNNIVLHAYQREGGTAEITITSLDGQLAISVRDEGAGMNPFPADAHAPTGLGFGVAMMASLSDHFAINSSSAGTEIRMVFAVHEGSPPARDGLIEEGPAADGNPLFESARRIDAEPTPPDDIVLALTPGAPTADVLSRFVSLLGAHARLSIDRVSDLQLVSDALARHGPRHAANGCFRVSAADHDSGFDLRVGPLEAGGSEAIIEDATLAGVGSVLDLLTDGVACEPVTGSAPGAEVLRLRLTRGARHA